MKPIFQKVRYHLYQQIVSFFISNGFSPVEVPLVCQTSIPESTIDLMQTKLTQFEKETPLYLTPSPEIFLKSLLAAGWGDLFCITKSFRNQEVCEGRHNPEFTMLEYYKTAATYQDSLLLTEALLTWLIERWKEWGVGEVPEYCKPPFARISIEEAFIKWVGFSLEEAVREGLFRKKMEEMANNPFENYSEEEIYQWAMVALIEPRLPKEKGLFLTDHPTFVPTTGKQGKNPFWTERWELYLRGLEIANCYTERSNKSEMKNYYLEEKKEALTETEERYLQQFDHFPPCSGTAMGLDRLLMAFLDINEINQILLFPQKDPTFI